MPFDRFHFAQSQFLWLLILIPLVFLLLRLLRGQTAAVERLKNFIDPDLLPHLLRNKTVSPQRATPKILWWSLVWLLGVLALAGPRWNYTDVQASKPERSLVIVLDLSKSMDTQDVQPSRLGRAREEISDILDASRGLNVGLVAFAAIPHLVVPLTDDVGTIRYLLPSLDTQLVALQGSNLKPAVQMAATMLGWRQRQR